jgi:hypothetical protein
MENEKAHYQKEWGKYRFIHRLYLTSFFVFVSFFVLFDFFAKMSSREFAGCLFLISLIFGIYSNLRIMFWKCPRCKKPYHSLLQINILGCESVVENEQKEGKGKFSPTMY